MEFSRFAQYSRGVFCLFVSIVALLLVVPSASAQTTVVTGPITSTDSIAFEAFSNTTAAQAAAFTYMTFRSLYRR